MCTWTLRNSVKMATYNYTFSKERFKKEKNKLPGYTTLVEFLSPEEYMYKYQLPILSRTLKINAGRIELIPLVDNNQEAANCLQGRY